MARLPIGIQLYTVRSLLQEDFQGTLKALAEMGYRGVEFAWNYGGMSPQELTAFLKELGLEVCGFHMKENQAVAADSEDYRYASGLGSPFVTLSMAAHVAKDWDAAVAEVVRASRLATESGFTFTYHNHFQEFKRIGGRYALDILYERTDPAQVKAELDTYWIRKGGEDPVAVIRKYAGRVPQIHLKDMNPDNGDFAPIGEGLMDLPAIFAAAEEAKAQWMIYEQDSCQGSPLDSAATSIENLKKAGLA